MSSLFHLSLSLSMYDVRRTISSKKTASDDTTPLIGSLQDERKNFFKDITFYQIAFLFVVARFFMQIATIYIPLWMNEQSNVDIEFIAAIPFASFIASFLMAMIFKQASRLTGHKLGYFMGCIIGVAGCLWIILEPSPSVLHLVLIAVFFGACHSILMISSLSLTANLIGSHSGQGGAVYSAVIFFAKLFTGVAVFIIESM